MRASGWVRDLLDLFPKRQMFETPVGSGVKAGRDSASSSKLIQTVRRNSSRGTSAHSA